MKMVVKTRSMPYCTCPTVGPRVILLNVEPGDTVAKVKQAIPDAPPPASGVCSLPAPPSPTSLDGGPVSTEDEGLEEADIYGDVSSKTTQHLLD